MFPLSSDLQILLAEVSDNLRWKQLFYHNHDYDMLCSLESPTLEEYIVYKLLQALTDDSYHNKCIFVPSLGNIRSNVWDIPL